jgi:hypothetical protein
LAISIKMKKGDLVGRAWLVVGWQDADPITILAELVTGRSHWEIDYSQATPEETFRWFRADMVCRAILAQKEGRPVYFEGREYADLQKWEDAVADSGQMVTIDRDDKFGYWVVGVGPEPTKH